MEQCSLEARVAQLERRIMQGHEDECSTSVLPYLYRLSMAAIVGGTTLGIVYFCVTN